MIVVAHLVAHPVAFVVALVAVLAALPALAQPQQQPATAAQDLAMAKEAEPYRRTAEEFVERAMAADTPATLKLLSRTLVERMGAEQARAVLQRQLQPFFVNGRGIGKNGGIARTTDSNGNPGFTFYLWLLPKAASGISEARPFVLHVASERGQRVVANVLPNQRVEGRHPNP